MHITSLEQALRVVGREELVKKASAQSEAYTFQDKDATILSFLRAQVEKAPSHIKHACAQHIHFWGLDKDAAVWEQKIASWRPAAPDRDSYALIIDGKHFKYAAYGPDSTVRAAQEFYEERFDYPLRMRETAASRILAKAAQFEAHMPAYANTYLHKAAGLALPTEASVHDSLMQRLHLTYRKHAQLSDKLAEFLTKFSASPEDMQDLGMVKNAVYALEQYDLECDLVEKYASHELELPEEMLSTLTFDRLEKLSGISKLAVTLTNGAVVDVSELSQDALAAVSPKLAGMDVGELIRVLPTLPKPDADLLVRVS